MRKEFSDWISAYGKEQKNFVFLTGDLGFNALENVSSSMGNRFVNAGVSEQNMVSMAAAMSQQGLTTLCYSIAPFAIFRPAEQIRLDVCLHNMDVKIVGNGGGYGYGIMGATHHAIEDIGYLSSLQNMKCYIPYCNEDVSLACKAMLNRKGPSFLRLGFGTVAGLIEPPHEWNSIRQITDGKNLTVVGQGPVTLNALKALKEASISADVFVVSEMPILEVSDNLIRSIERTQNLLVIEEHVQRGGLGEHLAFHLMNRKLQFSFRHLCARGYPDGKYGSQGYHQKMSQLDVSSISNLLQELK